MARVDESKCHPYFPHTLSTPQHLHGSFQIDLISGPSATNSYVTRLLKVTKTTLQCRSEKKRKLKLPLVSNRDVKQDSVLVEHRFIYHLEFVDWPLEGCPTDQQAFLDFLDAIESIGRQAALLKFSDNEDDDSLKSSSVEQKISAAKSGFFATHQNFLFSKNKSPKSSLKQTPQRPPCVVHCSAGVGRTGVVMLSLLGKKAIDHSIPLDLPSLLSSLRQQRMRLVTTIAQYSFVKQLLQLYLDSSRLI